MGRRPGPAGTAAAIVLACVGSWCTAPGSASAQDQDGRKIALVIAIGEYGTPPPHPVTGEPLRPYRPLNATNDVPLVVGALERQGFSRGDIQVLTDSAADATGIRAAFRRLTREAGVGDVVVVHYSGHGHRLGNDDPEVDEEPDGYDELLVPYGAPEEFYDGYEGALHIRDDELGEVVERLRRRVGPTGNVTVFLDACYSGTGTRGEGDLPARGSLHPLGPPAFRKESEVPGGERTPTPAPGPEVDAGTGVDLAAGTGTRGGDDDGLAPFAVFSAASQRQVAFETYDVDGRTRVGSLSYAIARTLPTATPGTTYRALFARMVEALSGKVPQTPQLEGTTDARLFSDRIVQQSPYVVFTRDTLDPDVVTLEGGSLLGINPGTRLVLHDTGTEVPDAADATATVLVDDGSPTRAVATVVDGTLPEAMTGGWAFVSQRSFGDLALRVRLDPSLLPRDREGLSRVLGEMGIIDLVDEGADVVVAAEADLPVARSADHGTRLGTGAVEVVRRVEDFARNRYLRRLHFATPRLEMAFRISPVEIETDLLGRPTGCGAPEWTDTAHPRHALGGNQWRFAPGEAYRLRVENTGDGRAFIAVLDLLPGGGIQVLRPREGEAASSYEIEAGGVLDLGCYQVGEETGPETLKVFATDSPQDFRATFSTRGTRGSRADGDLSALEGILASTYGGTRAARQAGPIGLATTANIEIIIEKGRMER